MDPLYEDALNRLNTFSSFEAAPDGNLLEGGTQRMQELLHRLGSPHGFIPCVHVAGTKGKGTVCTMVAAVMVSAGIKTGLYTSPHVNSIRERIIMDGAPVSEQDFALAAAGPLAQAEKMRAAGIPPTWFEVLTAIAFCAFWQGGMEAMVLETGLGGRLDATTLPDLRIAAVGITPISMDHEQILGSTLAQIAAEKAAIIHPDAPVVCALQAPDVMDVIKTRTREVRTRLFLPGQDFSVQRSRPPVVDTPDSGQRFDCSTWRSSYGDIPLGMLGAHQEVNVAIAVALSELFMEYMDREPLDSMILRRAWRKLQLPARLEVMGRKPWLVIDGAHNPASAWAAAEALQESFSTTSRTLVFGAAADKDWRAMLHVLAPLFERIVLTSFDSPRSLPPDSMLDFVQTLALDGKTVTTASGPGPALLLALSCTPPDGLVLCAGSFYLAGPLREYARNLKKQ